MKTPFTLRRDAFGRLVCVAADGATHENVHPARAFPLAAPGEGIALMSADGHELAWIERLADLPAETRALVEEEFARREFMPEIRRIVSVGGYATPSAWQVETDRGPTRLVLKSEDDIRRLSALRGPGALLIADADGIHYLIRDRDALDAHSRAILKRFL